MKKLKIFFDADYPAYLIESLQKIHELQTEKTFELHSWDNALINRSKLDEAVFLLMDFQKRGLSEQVLRHFEDGYRIFVCKAGEASFDYFEFAMTVLKVWPYIIENGLQLKKPFCFTFKYGGHRLNKKKID